MLLLGINCLWFPSLKKFEPPLNNNNNNNIITTRKKFGRDLISFIKCKKFKKKLK
jgi:hypothetical protein